ncbi:hypothetical protein EIP86_011395 [Pleurotus ostreatoroseus]|nr:hypothetical protein EIP86_011395 [Pleurotus ostreatoroseus]
MPDASAGHDLLKVLLMQQTQLPGYPGSSFTWNSSAQPEAGAPTVVESGGFTYPYAYHADLRVDPGIFAGDVDPRTVAEQPTPSPTPTPAPSHPTTKSHRKKSQSSPEAPVKAQSKMQERTPAAQSSTTPRTEQHPPPCPLATPPPEKSSQAPSGKLVRARNNHRKPAKSSSITIKLPPTLPMINPDQQSLPAPLRPAEPETQPIASSSKTGSKRRGCRRRASSSPQIIEASSSEVREDDPSPRASGEGTAAPADQRSSLPEQTAAPQDVPNVRATRGRVLKIPVPSHLRPTLCGKFCCTGKGEPEAPQHPPGKPPFCMLCPDEQGRFPAFSGHEESYDHMHDMHCNVRAGQNVIRRGRKKYFKCPWCGLITNCCSNTAKKHCAVHMGVRVPCAVCNTWFSNWSSLSYHRNNEHGVQNSEAGESQAGQPETKQPEAKQPEAHQFEDEEPEDELCGDALREDELCDDELCEDVMCADELFEAEYDAQSHNQGKKRKRDNEDSDYEPEGRRKRRA